MSLLGVDAVRTSWGTARFWPSRAPLLGLVTAGVIFLAYLAAVAIYPLVAPDGVALLWLPNAVIVTALVRFRPKDWPYVYIVALIAEVVGDATFAVAPYQALYFGAVNLIEATSVVLVAGLIAGGRQQFGLMSIRSALALVTAVLAVPALTGALGALGSVWTFQSEYGTAWLSWWFGDALGLAVGVPIGLLLRDAPRSVARVRPPMLLRVGLIVALAFIALASFFAVKGEPWEAQQLGLAAGLLLAVLLGAVGAPIATTVVSAVTLLGLAQSSALESVVRDQTLLFVVFAAIYLIASGAETMDRNNQELARANDQLDNFANRASHDLQAPLRRIDGFASMAREDLRDGEYEAAKESLSLVSSNVEKLQKLVKAVLEHGYSGGNWDAGDPVELRPLLDSVAEGVATELAECQGTLSVECRNDTRGLVHPVQFERLVQNLVENAIRYRDPSRPLVIGVSVIDRDDGLVLTVADNGLGMSEEVQSQAFELFFTTDPGGAGTGIGLASVQNIVEGHSGEVTLASTEGEGTTVRVVLPNSRV